MNPTDQQQQLKNALHQFLMQYYHSSLKLTSEKESKQLVLREIERQYAYFTEHALTGDQPIIDALTSKIAEINQAIQGTTDSDMKLYLTERSQLLQDAIKVMRMDFKS